MIRTITCRAGLATIILAAAAGTLPAKESNVEMLTAGPVTCEFRDGELRYLYVGQKEIVRRIYFAVRDDTWQTPMPVFSKADVQKTADSFKIALTAKCKSETVNCDWTGQIEGTADGTIKFSVQVMPAKTFKSNRIGLCVLYGADSLVGQEFEAVSSIGKTTAGKWPALVSMDLVAKDYETLRYKTPDGVGVECSLWPVLFSMEDQRNWGDSSFKSYNTVLTGPEAKAGETYLVATTLKVTGAKPAPAAADDVVKVKIGKEIPGAKLPKIIPAKDSKAAGDWLDLDKKRDQLKDEAQIQLGYKCSSHLPDDDTFMENRTTLEWQLKTLRTLAPKAKFRVDPIRLTDGDDPRSKGNFAASWWVGALKYLTLGGADEVCFKMDNGALRDLARGDNAEKRILATEVMAVGRPTIEAFAISIDAKDTGVFVANSTDRPQKVEILVPDMHSYISNISYLKKAETKSVAGGIQFELGPYETCIVDLSQLSAPPRSSEDKPK